MVFRYLGFWLDRVLGWTTACAISLAMQTPLSSCKRSRGRSTVQDAYEQLNIQPSFCKASSTSLFYPSAWRLLMHTAVLSRVKVTGKCDEDAVSCVFYCI